jgi:hypothetical protein
VDGSDTAGQVLVTLTSDNKASILNHVPKFHLAREPLDALNEVLVAVSVSGDQLADQGNGTERPLLVDGVEQGILVDLGELEAGKDTARLENSVSLLQGSRDVGEIADAKGNGIEVERVVLKLSGEDLSIGLEEREGGLVGCGEGEGTLATHGQHVGVDIGDGNCHVGIAIELVGVL